jgi:hypothetical protein
VTLESPNVRFGSKADICAATSHVRFTPNSDRESEIPQKAMSALPPKADMCSARGDVCFGPAFPDLNIREIRRRQRKYWTAFKHATHLRGKGERDDDAVLREFTDDQNDHALFIGWYDYALAVNKLPVEAQATKVGTSRFTRKSWTQNTR